jgi:membrane fusion protein (multidrug efflux system)
MNKNYRDGKIKLARLDDFKVEVIMPDGSVYPQVGRIIFVDSGEDSQTSSVSIKAEIPNNRNQKLLLPGQFVRVKLIGAEYKDALVIPQSALISTNIGEIVYVVKDDKVVEVRPVKAELVGDKVVVNSGLKEGEVVVSEGIIKARPGQPVNAVLKSGDSKQ